MATRNQKSNAVGTSRQTDQTLTTHDHYMTTGSQGFVPLQSLFLSPPPPHLSLSLDPNTFLPRSRFPPLSPSHLRFSPFHQTFSFSPSASLYLQLTHLVLAVRLAPPPLQNSHYRPLAFPPNPVLLSLRTKCCRRRPSLARPRQHQLT